MVRRWIEKITQPNKSLVFRINILKGICCLIFLAIAIQLYQVQVIYSGKFKAFLDTGTFANLQRNVPRGIITDRNGVVLVDNEAVDIITFQQPPGMTRAQVREVAADLAQLIEVETDHLTSRDLRDLFITLFPDEARDLITDEEFRELEDDEIYRLQLQRIEDEHLALLTEEDKVIHAIFINMDQGSNLLANTVKKGATREEIARVSERLHHLPGVGVDVDWNRQFPSDVGQMSIFGNVSSHDRGLPAQRLDYFLAHGYERNARVGLSQIEMVNQSLLGGFPSQYVVENGISNILVEGQQGYEIALTIDVELQAYLSDLVATELLNARLTQPQARFVREAYAVMMDPNTGEILAMVGKVLAEDDNGNLIRDEQGNPIIIDNSIGTFQNAFTVGSTIKAATWLSGVESGATRIGQTRRDSTLRFPGSYPISSHRREGMGIINEIVALSWSSNIFFMRQIMQMAGVPDFNNDSPSLGSFNRDLWVDMRSFFNEFGLGSSTGIDLPNESTGQREPNTTAINLLQFGIGQSDTYTTMQLAQFASTLATNGKRFAATVVRDVYLPGANSEERQLVQGFSPTLLNIVDIDQSYFDQVHLGHRQTLIDPARGTGTPRFGVNAPFYPVGKTGTAQDTVRGRDGNNRRDGNGNLITVHSRSFIGYAPMGNPEVAIAVIVPQNELPPPYRSSPMSLDISRRGMEKFFELQQARAQ